MHQVPLQGSALPSTAAHQYLACTVQVHPGQDKRSGKKAVGPVKLEAGRSNVNTKRGTQSRSPGSHHPRSHDGSDASSGVASPAFPPCPVATAHAGRRGLSISDHPSSLPPQTATGPATEACCKPISTQTPTRLQEADPGHRDAAGTMVAPAAPSLGPCHCSPQQNHAPAVSQTALVKVTLSLTAEGSSLEESELNKLDLITELQSFSV